MLLPNGHRGAQDDEVFEKFGEFGEFGEKATETNTNTNFLLQNVHMASSVFHTFRSSPRLARTVRQVYRNLLEAPGNQPAELLAVRSSRAVHTGATAAMGVGAATVGNKNAGRSAVASGSALDRIMSELRSSRTVPSQRWLSSSRTPLQPDDKETHAERRKRRREEQKAAASLATIEEEEFSAITDRIPQRPMGAVESTSYSLVILAALGFAAAVLYAAFSELIFSPKEYTSFSKTLKKIEEDPRVTIRLGSPMKAYGTESQNRSARQRIPHRIYSDDQGREHVQLQFVAKGPSGRATVHADMYEDGEAAGGWRYH